MYRYIRNAILVSLSCVILFSGCVAAQAVPEARAPQPLKVLYAGNPDTDRMRDFVSFLEQHFTTVGTCNFEELDATKAEDFDVVVCDWTSIYPRDASGKIDWSDLQLLQPKVTVDRNLTKPIVMIGAAAQGFSMKHQLAIDWKCLCLDNYAHDMNIEHPIFQGPLPVTLVMETIDVPSDYYLYPGVESLEEKLNVWKVQTKTMPEIDPGLVSSEERFVETKDAEIISSGVNGKGPRSVAIGRHARFFLWGFSAMPSDMTDEARRVFVNAICYMDQFDGQEPKGVIAKYDARDQFVKSLYQLRVEAKEMIDLNVAKLKETMKDESFPKEQLEMIGEDPRKFIVDMNKQITQRIKAEIPASILAKYDTDVNSMIQMYASNAEYLIKSDDGTYEVDEDAKQLGVSNRSTQILQRAIEQLRGDSDGDLARRVLERYTSKDFSEPSEWRSWFEKYGERLVFDQTQQKFYLE